MGYVKTGMLMAAMTALFMGVGYALGGQGGALLALLFAAGTNLWAWYGSDQAVLRMHNAQVLTRGDRFGLTEMVGGLAQNAGLPMPAVYIINQPQPNAFATGRNPENAAVAVTTGLLQALSREELAGVIAHELAHIRNRDTLIMTITATFAGAITMLANFAMFFGGRDNRMGFLGTLAMMMLAPFAAMLVQMAISRTREYAADRAGAEICGQPLWLASALAKIAGGAAHIPNETAERSPATAHMFIINPLSGRGADNLFATHPATENRIAELRKLAGAGGAQPRQPLRARPGRDARSGGPWG